MGYPSDDKYQVSRKDSDRHFSVMLELVRLPQPHRKRDNHVDTATLDHYHEELRFGFSFGAYDRDQCVSIALAEPR